MAGEDDLTVNESVEAAVRGDLAQLPHVIGSGLAASALSLAKAMDRKPTSLIAKELRETLAELKSVEAPKQEASELDRLRAERSKRRA